MRRRGHAALCVRLDYRDRGASEDPARIEKRLPELDPCVTLLREYRAFGSDEEAIAELDRLATETAHDPEASPRRTPGMR